MFIYVIKLLIMLSYIFIFIIPLSFTFGQVDNVNITIESRNIKANQNQYLEQLKNDIEFYLISNDFIETNNENIKISLDINLIVESIANNNHISARILFSNRIDQILFSDGIDLKYELGQNLIYTTSYHPLTSFLNYNIFIMIANELDKHHYRGGENYYIRSEDIASQGEVSDYPRKWNKRLKQLKQLKDNLYLRNIKYLHHKIYKYLNAIDDEFDDQIIIELLEEIYADLINIDNDYGEHKSTLLFLNANLNELAELYYEYDMIYAIKFLRNYDENNSEFYSEYID